MKTAFTDNRVAANFNSRKNSTMMSGLLEQPQGQQKQEATMNTRQLAAAPRQSSNASAEANPMGSVSAFSVPEKLLRFADTLPQLLPASRLAPANSLQLLPAGGYICEYRNGAADVREFFAQLGWPQLMSRSSEKMCGGGSVGAKTIGACGPNSRHWNCACVQSALSAMPDFAFFWGSLSSTTYALCMAASQQRRRPMVMNRIPWVTLISNKSQLAATCMAHKHSSASLCLQSHIPATFIVDRDTDRSSLPALARRLLAMHPVWIVKPHNYAKGEGIQLAFREDGEMAMLRSLSSDRWGIGKVVQCYMTDPMLLGGKKFDLRVFLLLVTTGSGLLAFYHTGYVRLALNNFLVCDKQRLDTHLTNQAVQAKQSGYEANKEGTIWTVQQMNSYLNQLPDGEFGNDWTVKQLHPTVKSLVAVLVEALAQRVQKDRRSSSSSGKQQQWERHPCRNTFSLLGLDVLVDAAGKPWLIEANADPALSRQTRTLERLLPAISAEAFGLAMEIIYRCHGADPQKAAPAPSELAFLQNFQPIGFYSVTEK